MKATDVVEFWSERLQTQEVYVAGGAVRDELMGRTPKDYDVFVLDPTISIGGVAEATKDLEDATPLGFHKSEPFMAGQYVVDSVVHQVMNAPYDNVVELLDSFDWNVALFAIGTDGLIHARTDIADIAPGKPLVLSPTIRFPRSTIRRGVRFSERFGMEFRVQDLDRLCAQVASTILERATKTESGEEQ